MHTVLPSRMEPLFPTARIGELQELALEVVRCSAALGSLLRSESRQAVVILLRKMNSYYSNLNGRVTRPESFVCTRLVLK